jgi:hypothetical protein
VTPPLGLTPCDYACEATSYETLCLWDRHHQQHGIPWEDERGGYAWIVGRCAEMPVVVVVCWARILGRRIAFYEATSQVVDHRQVEAWVRAHVLTPGGERCDAMNFGHVLDAIEDANRREVRP